MCNINIIGEAHIGHRKQNRSKNNLKQIWNKHVPYSSSILNLKSKVLMNSFSLFVKSKYSANTSSIWSIITFDFLGSISLILMQYFPLFRVFILMFELSK